MFVCVCMCVLCSTVVCCETKRAMAKLRSNNLILNTRFIWSGLKAYIDRSKAPRNIPVMKNKDYSSDLSRKTYLSKPENKSYLFSVNEKINFLSLERNSTLVFSHILSSSKKLGSLLIELLQIFAESAYNIHAMLTEPAGNLQRICTNLHRICLHFAENYTLIAQNPHEIYKHLLGVPAYHRYGEHS